MPSPDSPAEGFAKAFLSFRARLARAVARIVLPRDVEDIVQETFLRCYQASAKATIRHPRSFMLTTAKNLALNHVTKADNRLVRGVASFDESAVPLFIGRSRPMTIRSGFSFFARRFARCRCNAGAHSF
jgi:DNA-directed RNA polymerase specialized sigma24 family protein